MDPSAPSAPPQMYPQVPTNQPPPSYNPEAMPPAQGPVPMQPQIPVPQAGPVPVQQLPPGPPAPVQQLPPPVGHPPPQAAPPQAQMAGGYPPPTYPHPVAQMAPVQQVVVVQPGALSGLNVLDAFRSNNEIQLVARCNALPIRIHAGDFYGCGDFAQQCNFRVHVVGGNIVMLQSVQSSGLWMAIHNNKCVDAKGRGDIFSQFKIHLLPDNYVMLESVKMPGHFVNMTGNGRSKPPASISMTDPDGQFYVRVSKQMYAPSQTIFNAMGAPSVLNTLQDKMLVQLVGRKSNQCFMCKGGGQFAGNNIVTDKSTVFTMYNRGMGIVSFRSHPYEGYWIRIVKGNLVNKGGEQQLSGDFRVIENPDGSCSFELVNVPGQFLNLKGEKDWTMFKIDLVGNPKNPNITRTQMN